MAAAAALGSGVKAALLFILLLTPLRATTFYLTVAGLGGEPDYEQRFKLWAGDAEKSWKSSGAADVQTLEGPGATKAALRAALERIAKQAKPEDALVVLLIGHGTFDGADYKFNLPGPDITANELAALLNAVHAGRQLVANMTSASGASQAALKHPNRVVITATRSGTEKNAPTFARFWVEALRDEAADTDKNGTVSALEAFHYAEAKTSAFFAEQKHILTEHAQVDDTARAAQFALLRSGGAAEAAANPAKRELVQRKESIENQIDQLKFQKSLLPADEYKQQLTALLLQLARVQDEIEK